MSTYGTASVARTFVVGEGFRQQLVDLLPARVADAVDWQGTCDEVAGQVSDAVSEGLVGAADAAHIVAALGGTAQNWVTEAMVDALSDIGFAVHVDDGGPVSAVRAERGHEVFGAEIREGGGFAFDVAGVEGDGCQSVVDQVVAGLDARGVQSEVVLHPHNDPRGGQLLRRVDDRTRSRTRSQPGRGRAGRVAG